MRNVQSFLHYLSDSEMWYGSYLHSKLTKKITKIDITLSIILLIDAIIIIEYTQSKQCLSPFITIKYTAKYILLLDSMQYTIKSKSRLIVWWEQKKRINFPCQNYLLSMNQKFQNKWTWTMPTMMEKMVIICS